MNKQDNKLFQIANGYNPQKESDILSFSLCPKSYKKLMTLRKNIDRRDIQSLLNDWIETLEVKDYTLSCVNDSIDVELNEYKHKDYRFNSFYVKSSNKKKIKTIAVINNVTVSSLVRAFLMRLE